MKTHGVRREREKEKERRVPAAVDAFRRSRETDGGGRPQETRDEKINREDSFLKFAFAKNELTHWGSLVNIERRLGKKLVFTAGRASLHQDETTDSFPPSFRR